MTPSTHDTNETRTLLVVAGLVIAGVAGIALLAGLTADRENALGTGATVRPVHGPVRHASLPDPERLPVARPASLEQRTVPVVDPSPTEPAAEPWPVFEIDPSENFVLRAIEKYEAREFAHAAAYLLAEIEIRPERAWSHYMLGLSLWKTGRADEAVVAMERATVLDPRSVKSFVNLSRIHNDRGAHAQALEAAAAALAIDPNDASARFLEGRSRLNLGQKEEAIMALEASLAIDPENGYVRNLLGLAFLQQNRFEEAAPVLERAAELEPRVAFIRNNLGMALEHSGRRSEAVTAYRRAVEIDAAHASAAANLARLEPVTGEGPVALETTEELVEVGTGSRSTDSAGAGSS